MRARVVISKWVAAIVLCGVFCALPLWIGRAPSGAADEKPSAPGERTSKRPIDFSLDIRPILSEHCFRCHGPDDGARQAELRLDQRESALGELESGGRAIVPGELTHSELFRRITSSDPSERMPPEETGKKLSPRQIALVREWIESGASWGPHWAYVAPRRHPLPQVMDAKWAVNAVDRFILARLEAEGIAPSPRASKETLIRRLSLDLTGLGPTPDEVDAFRADDRPDAYERLVDRLLASPRHGEWMALHWLDLARYADTHGYHTDSHRDMWRWRDWVIAAYNRNMPFDRFTIEQIAGDLLTDATLEQTVATGFNRNNMVNFENGAIAEEYRTEYVADRVVTTATVWLGQTMRCARCHDHKFDPISQRDFYRMFAFFNSVPEKGLDGQKGNAEPFIAAPTALQTAHLEECREQLAALERKMAERAVVATDEQREWEARLREGSGESPRPPDDVILYCPLDEGKLVEKSGDTPVGGAPHVEGNAIQVPGRFGDALLFDGNTHVDLGHVAALDRESPFSCGAWVYRTTDDTMTILARVSETEDGRGFAIELDEGRPAVRLVHKWPDSAQRVLAKGAVASRKWQHVAVTYDGSSKAAGIRIYIDGALQEIAVERDTLDGTIEADAPLLLGRRGSEAPFRGMIDELRLYGRALTATDAALLAGSDPIREIAAVAPDKRTAEQSATIESYFLNNCDEPYRQLAVQAHEVRRRQTEIEAAIPTTMVMQEMDTPRETFVLERGAYDHPTDRVTPGVPEFLPPLPEGAPANRLAFARWLVDPANPLTARVTVNRYWQMLFGAGIVATADDFGVRGDSPSHPELLDWLACEFVDSGWDTQHMLRLMVTSAAYRQTSAFGERARPLAEREATGDELLARDPHNRLLARATRMRLPAEAIRDNALSAAGMLSDKIGGRSVYPYQPPGLWEEVSYNPNEYSAQKYTQSHGEALYRRGMYTFWKRSVPPPALAALDAPDREVCTVTRFPSNTPLQALVLMNDPTFVEAARALAQRVMTETADDPSERVALIYRLVLGRRPLPEEAELLLEAYDEQLAQYRQIPDEAVALLSVGESPRDTALDACEHAAWTTVASIVLNIDEAITKP